MDYQEVIDRMYARLPMFSRIGDKALKANLSNTITLSHTVKNPHLGLRCIHIAGTNGKGSVSNMLASIFQEAGYKTGLYTSPHLKDFRERIRINGEMIGKEEVIKYYNKLIKTAEEIQSSFFEMTVVMAFAYFRDHQTDIAIIETGLGGRLDSTNVVQPNLSIITNIGWDHQQFLGNTLSEIASEKAGIIKENMPVLIGQYSHETAKVFLSKALEKNAPIFFSNEFQHDVQLIDNSYFSIDQQKINCPLLAKYQTFNIHNVIAAIDILQSYHDDIHISFENIKNGLENIIQNTHFQGRWQKIREQPKVIADVAHNIDGIHEVLNQLSGEKFKNLKIVYGAVKDKDVRQIIQILPRINTTYYLCEPPLPRKLPVEELQIIAAEESLPIQFVHKNPVIAYQKALSEAEAEDLILVMGSFFIVGEII